VGSGVVGAADGVRGCGGQRVVTAGTCAEYSWEEGGDGICREDATLLRPSTLYGTSKDALRRMQESMARTLGFSAAWGRVFFPYGVGEPAGRLVPSVIDNVLGGSRRSAAMAGRCATSSTSTMWRGRLR
jgi:nucleoside-diphosphate-sugar epimerase